jgi:hypothetical protein
MSTFSSRPINCPHCGHPFVLWMKYLQHAKACAEAKQEELDRKWERDRRDRLPLGLKHARYRGVRMPRGDRTVLVFWGVV